MFGLVQALQNLNSKYAQSTPHDTAPPWNFEWDKRNASLFNISDKLCDNCHRSHYKFSSISQMFFLRSTPCENNKNKIIKQITQLIWATFSKYKMYDLPVGAYVR